MPINKEDLHTILRKLIEICRDGNQGYKDAGDDVGDKKLHDILHEYSEQRMNFSLELKNLMEKHGGDIDLTGTILGSLHRRWMDVRFGVLGGKTGAILEECLRGEGTAKKKYESALGRDLPGDVKKVVSRQYSEICAAIDTLEKLADEYRLSAAAE